MLTGVICKGANSMTIPSPSLTISHHLPISSALLYIALAALILVALAS
jgi:hypothetical protein